MRTAPEWGFRRCTRVSILGDERRALMGGCGVARALHVRAIFGQDPLVSPSPPTNNSGLAVNRYESPSPRPFDNVRNVVYTVRNFVFLRLAAHHFVSLHCIAAST
jgi:hypothetical protein